MTDAEFKVQKERIQALADKWLGCLGLLWWTIHIDYCREPEMKVNGEYSPGCRAQASVMWQYMTATLTFCMPKVAECDDDDLERTFVHECCHVLVHEMREWCPQQCVPAEQSSAAMMHEERVCCLLERSLLWTRLAGAGKFDSVTSGPKKTRVVKK